MSLENPPIATKGFLNSCINLRATPLANFSMRTSAKSPVAGDRDHRNNFAKCYGAVVVLKCPIFQYTQSLLLLRIIYITLFMDVKLFFLGHRLENEQPEMTTDFPRKPHDSRRHVDEKPHGARWPYLSPNPSRPWNRKTVGFSLKSALALITQGCRF